MGCNPSSSDASSKRAPPPQRRHGALLRVTRAASAADSSIRPPSIYEDDEIGRQPSPRAQGPSSSWRRGQKGPASSWQRGQRGPASTWPGPGGLTYFPDHLSSAAASGVSAAPYDDGKTLAVRAIKAELRRRLSELASRHGDSAALLPGLPEEKGRIDKLIEELAAHSRTRRNDRTEGTSSLSTAFDVQLPRPGTSAPIENEHLDQKVLGDWELVYASNGTVSYFLLSGFVFLTSVMPSTQMIRW